MLTIYLNLDTTFVRSPLTSALHNRTFSYNLLSKSFRSESLIDHILSCGDADSRRPQGRKPRGGGDGPLQSFGRGDRVSYIPPPPIFNPYENKEATFLMNFYIHHLAVAAYQEHASLSVKYNDVPRIFLFRGLLKFLVPL